MPYKQVIVMRKDLNMRKGKMVAQGCHASSMAVLECKNSDNETLEKWICTGMTKVCVYVESEEELLSINKKAMSAGLKPFLITDAGRTEFKGVPTTTCLAIGPAKSSSIDPVTKELKLL